MLAFPLVKKSFTHFRSRFCLLILFFSTLSFQVYSQDEKWNLLEEKDGIQVYVQITECEQGAEDLSLMPAEKLKLRFVNNNAETRTLEYFKEIKVDGNQGASTVTLPAGTTDITSCDQLPNVRLTMVPDDGFPVSMSEFFKLFSVTIK